MLVPAGASTRGRVFSSSVTIICEQGHRRLLSDEAGLDKGAQRAGVGRPTSCNFCNLRNIELFPELDTFLGKHVAWRGSFYDSHGFQLCTEPPDRGGFVADVVGEVGAIAGALGEGFDDLGCELAPSASKVAEERRHARAIRAQGVSYATRFPGCTYTVGLLI